MEPVRAQREGGAGSPLPTPGASEELAGGQEETQLLASRALLVTPQDRSSPCPQASPGPGGGSSPLWTKATLWAQQVPGCNRVKKALCGLSSSQRCIIVAVFVAVVILVLISVIWLKRPISLPSEPCPEDWLYFKRKCYYLSEDEKDWESSQSFCSQYEASLAVIENHQEMRFLTKRMHMQDSWIGLRKREEGFYWANGIPFTTDLFPIQDHEECAYTDSSSISTSACSLPRRWICSCHPSN